MDNKLLDVEGRVKSYWYSDGIAEISVGLVFLILGLFFGAQGYFGEESKVGLILQLSMIVVMMGTIFGTQWLVNTLKARLTYPRTGYVEYRAKDKESSQRRMFIIVIGLVVAVASMVTVGFFREVDSMVLVSSILVGVVFIFLRGKSSGVFRFYYLGALSFILGIILTFNDLTRLYNLGIFYGLLGAVMILTGFFVLQKYLRDNPMPAEDDNE